MRLFKAALVLAVVSLQTGTWAQDVPFVRADANDDGDVGISDAHFIQNFLFRGGAPSDCFATMDSNDDGKLNIADTIFVLSSEFLAGPPIPAPFPEAGLDPTPNEGPFVDACDAYGLGSPLEDAVARISLVDAVAAGGEDGTARLSVRVSNSTTLGGFGLVLDVPEVIQNVRLSEDTPPIVDEVSFLSAEYLNGEVSVGMLTSLVGFDSIPPGEDVEVVVLEFCLATGASGDHEIGIASAELVDFESARAILPALEGTVLSIDSPVTVETICKPTTGCQNPPCGPEPVHCDGGPVDVEFRLASLEAAPGSRVEVPFNVIASAGVQGISFSVDFDETLLTMTNADFVWEKPDWASDPEYGFSVIEFNTDDTNPGSGGVDEGFVIGALVVDFVQNVTLPRDEVTELARFGFDIDPGAPEMTTEIRFLDGGQIAGQGVRNVITACGTAVEPELAGSFVFLDCTLQVLPDITSFIRGDTNDDEIIDISDPQVTLDFLFVGEGRPFCYDAADANDDGKMDITDSIFTLTFLFLGGAEPPAPFPERGEDPTHDRISCFIDES